MKKRHTKITLNMIFPRPDAICEYFQIIMEIPTIFPDPYFLWIVLI